MYRGLGQAKLVPGQINFMTLPQGRTSLPSLQPLVEAGLPIAPYIEHGSWETGEPAIMRYGLDPYRGIMGLGQVPEWMVREMRATLRDRRLLRAHGLAGQEDAMREFVVQCDNWAQIPNVGPGRRFKDARAAMAEAMNSLRIGDNRHDTCRIYLLKPRGSWYRAGEEIVSVRLRANGSFDVRTNRSRAGMGDILTDYACSNSELNRTWTARTRSTMGAAAQAALIGGAAAGLVGAISKNPFLAAAAGAGIAFGSMKLWTAPYEV